MIWGSELVLAVFVVGFVLALAQRFVLSKEKETTAEVVAQLVLVVVIGALLGVMIAVARDPVLTFNPKLVFTS